jgi:hypothetical protein
MTASEQNELLLGNFEAIWWAATLYKKDFNPELYAKKLQKYNTFLSIYNLESLISQSTSSLSLWEIPKGKPTSVRESDVNCAVREFYEEKSMYKIIFSPVKYSFQENNYTYTITYFPAICKFLPHIGRIQPTKKNQVCEIVEMRWMDLNMVRAICNNGRLETIVKRVFNAIKLESQTHRQLSE